MRNFIISPKRPAETAADFDRHLGLTISRDTISRSMRSISVDASKNKSSLGVDSCRKRKDSNNLRASALTTGRSLYLLGWFIVGLELMDGATGEGCTVESSAA